MTDKEIIKALNGADGLGHISIYCADNNGKDVCSIKLVDIIDLINRQQAEIEDLKEAKEKAAATAMRVIKRQDAEIKRLLTRLTRFNEKIAQPYILINTDAELTAEMKEALRTQKPVFVPDNEGTVIRIDKASIKAEAIKEFADRLKEKAKPHYFDNYAFAVPVAFIDNLVKEMVGEIDV